MMRPGQPLAAADAPVRPTGTGRVAAADLPDAQADWGYFLDFDGTLVEIASHPGGVRTDVRLRALLKQLWQETGGAVALISGRPIAELDALLGLPFLAAAGQHGAERRDGRGSLVVTTAIEPERLTPARTELRQLVARYPQLVFEDKGLSLALHYRLAPALAGLAHRTMRSLQASLGSDYMLQPGKRVVELKAAGFDKGSAVRDFLKEPPFAGRRPVFIGDDSTDEHAFALVNRHGGISVKVGRGRTVAACRLPTVEEVRSWLEGSSRSIASRAPAEAHSSPHTIVPHGRD